MKYIKKYKLLEREDLQKREEILIFLDDIVLIVKNYFINIIDNLIEGKKKAKDYTQIKVFEIVLDKKYKFIIIYQLNYGGGSYAEDRNGNNFLIISLGKDFNKIIRDIFISNSNLEEIKNKIINYKLDKDTNDILFHELIHATDDMKFNIFKDFMKVVKLRTLYNNEKTFKDPEYTEEYFKHYPNFTTEYNAYFMMAVNMLIKNIKNNDIDIKKIKEFDDFKNYFINLTKKYYDLYTNTTKFKKNYDKRMYDLYTKLKEKYL
jgi:hypothetical protein